MTSPTTISTEVAPPGGRLVAGTLVPVAAVLAVLVVALNSSGYVVTVIGFAAIYGLFTTGLNFFMGYTGQASFGQNAFAALGGYGSAILTANYYWDPLAAIIVAMVFAGVVAAIVGLSHPEAARPLPRHGDLRARPDHLRDQHRVDGADPGLHGHFRHSAPRRRPWELATEKQMLVALAIALLLGVWISVRLRDSRFGRALRAIAGSEAGGRRRSASTSLATSCSPSSSRPSTPRPPARSLPTSSASSARRCSGRPW